MLRRDELRRFAARTGSVGLLAMLIAASAAGASLPTGGMLLPRPKGPARNDLPASTSIGIYRVPSARAYGISIESRSTNEASLAFTNVPPSVSSAAPMLAQTSERRPLIQPRSFATDEPESAFSPLQPAAGQPLELNPFDASGNGSPAQFADLRTPEVAEAASDDPNNLFAGLKGICPVALREERRVVTPRQELFSIFGGRRFEFATADAKAAFDAAPTRYAPVLGGCDVVLTASGAEDAVGSLKHAVFYRERLYLFQSDESCQAFRQNPRRFAVQD
jgi:hypothetical protein